MAKTVTKNIAVVGISAVLLSFIVGSEAKENAHRYTIQAAVRPPVIDTPITEPVKLPYPYTDQSAQDPLNYPNSGGLLLNNPSNVNTEVEYDPSTGHYNISQKMGDMNYRPPTYMDKEEYERYRFNQQVKNYWNQRVSAESPKNKNNAIIPKLNVGGEAFDRIFGGNTVDIRPNGSAELIFGYNGTQTKNPALPIRQQKVGAFNFDMKINLNVIGKIGDKLKLTTSYNTESTFDFENQMKLEYTGYEDEIIKKIEAGNVSMPLNGSLITGSQTLFGVKTQLQFGKLTVTAIASQQKGKKSEIEVTGGAQITPFEVGGDAYEANKHYFLGQYFRDTYNSALAKLPFVNSQITINRIEVWVSNTNASTIDVRSVVGFTELAEDSKHIPDDVKAEITDGPGIYPSNDQNNLYDKIKNRDKIRTTNFTVSEIDDLFHKSFKQQINYELFNARKLQPSEYTLNTRLGYISLNQQLNPEQVLSVSYQYTVNGKIYQVGEFSDGGIAAPQALYAKMLKSSNTTSAVKSTTTGRQVTSELWNLMMKNVYSLGAYQISPKDFKLDVLYFNAGSYINYFPEPNEPKLKSTPLLQVLKLDSLNQQNDQQPDGVFDFIDGVTINASNGRLIFPVIEPFGARIRSQFTNPLKANIYAFNQLYDSSRTVAISQYPNLNRYKIKGQYESSSSSDISLGAPNVPEGSVMVTAGGIQLKENQDYTVDYTLGRVKIINDGILNSGTPIKVSLESNALFAIQSKTLIGTHLDYRINKDFNIGGTILNLTERPITKKVNIGDEPVSNTIWGLDGNYSTEAPFLTRWIDKIPLLETKEMSTITAAAEFAYLIPGHSKAIGKAGNSYIDDFEGSQTTIDLKTPDAWRIASTPQGQPGLFPEASYKSKLEFGFNRAALSWYVIDPILLSQQTGAAKTPSNITKDMMSNNFMRSVREQEVFPSKQSANGISNLSTLDLAYYPSERGPYNYDVKPSAISKGLDPAGNGNLAAPQTRWGGMMRALSTNDFEAQNVEYIQFWVMDPFNEDLPVADRNTTGDLFFNIGNISEDVLNDSYKSAENVLPAPSTSGQNGGKNLPVDTTAWGLIPSTQPLVNAFNSDPNDRAVQDVGLDGLDNATEKTFFANYLKDVNSYAPQAYNAISNDPSADDFHYFRGDDYDAAGLNTLQRYKKWTGMENNSPAATSDYSRASTQSPNTEDLNHDNTLSTVESYYQYRISLKPSAFAAGVGNNYITDVYTASTRVENGRTKDVKWYQFKIPLKTSNAQKVGQIENFQSIRFLRMYLKNVDKPIVLRFAKLDLVRGEWRKYGYDLLSPGLYEPNDNNGTQFDVSAVNIEENGNKQPVNYVLPPGIDREINAGSAQLLAQNEQAMSLNVCGLQNGDSRAAFKNTQLDIRQYKKLKMYVHAEGSPNPAEVLNDNDLHMFIRLGADYTDNYYEYDIPLKVTPKGNYNGTNEDDQKKVWPDVNEMILEFDKLHAAKQERNNALAGHSGGISLNKEYKKKDGNRTISIKGNPNLSAVRIIMIGVRNPAKENAGDTDDGLPKCGQIWVNELRLSDFDQTGGWATNARVTAKLADFGNLALSGSMSTPGFGSIENKVNERKKETAQQYDISSTLELGKFVPQKYNVHVPMYIGYSQLFVTPQFNPLDPDIILKDQYKDQSIAKPYRDSLRYITQDRTTRKSINFTNVKKDKSASATKSKIYDIENWAATYSYSELDHRNVNIEYNIIKNYRGGLIYNYSFAPKNIKPFDKIKFFQPKYFQLIKDINFYLVPSNLGFSTDVNREYTIAKNRNVTGGNLLILPTYNKLFNMNRNYNFKYDITKGLNIDFTANNQERVLEPDGIVTNETKDTLKREFFDRLKKTQYNQQVNVNYTIPINKLPLLDFTSASVRYGSTYNWTHSPLYNTQKDKEGKLIVKDTLGNLITNSQSIQWSGQLTMTTLYNKIPYFKKVNQNQNKRKPAAKPAVPNKTPSDSTAKKENSFPVMDHIARFIMSLKTVSGSYSNTNGTVLPNYRPNMQVLGLDEHFDGPTVGFTLGSQKDITKEAISKNWLVKTGSLNSPYQLTNSKKLNLRANLEPIKDLRIELTALRSESTVKSQIIRWDQANSQFIFDTPMETGSFSMTYIAYRTSFKKGDAVFNNFLDSRSVVSARLKENNSNSTSMIGKYAQGYNETSQDVLIPAFLASYGGKSPNSVSLNQFPKIPKPNWRITYDGLSKLESIKKYFKSFTLSNAYTSTYNVNSYATNLLYQQDARGNANAFEAASTFSNNPNFISRNTINNITLSENWSPLIRVDMTLNNSLAINCEYKNGRSLSLGLSSRTITEAIDREVVVGAGYRIKDVQISKDLKIKGKPVKSDLNLKADLSFRNNQTIMRQIVEEISQATAGNLIISLKLSADYIINERISVRAFYDRIITKPVTSLSFPTTNTNAGVALRLTLSN